MTGTRAGNNNKNERALELFEKGLTPDQIAERLGVNPRLIWTMLRNARKRRERELERAGKLADILGANI
jgi:DNA-directed RNA polymerase specialized sigma24 family protein